MNYTIRAEAIDDHATLHALTEADPFEQFSDVAAIGALGLAEDAQRQGFLIRPDCSYVAKKFSENSEWGSLKA